MFALDKDGRELEELVQELLNSKDLEQISDEKDRVQIQIQLIRNLSRKYYLRPQMYQEQIAYLKGIIQELEKEL